MPTTPSVPSTATTTFTAGPDYSTRLTRAWVRYALTRPPIVAALIAYVALMCVAGLFSTSPTGPVGGVILPLAVLVVVIVALWALLSTRGRRQFRATTPAGAYSLSLGESALTLSGPNGKSETAYRVFTSARSRGDVVFVTYHGSALVLLLPVELLPGAQLAALQAKIEAARSA